MKPEDYTPEQFIVAIEARGFKRSGDTSFSPERGPIYVKRIGGGGSWRAVVGKTRASIDGKGYNSFALRYEFITDELITACAGKQK